jgi:hypothetical protein
MSSHRLISATGTEALALTPRELVAAIGASEGRVLMSQSLLWFQGLQLGITNPELESAFGADLLLLNGYDTRPGTRMPGMLRSMLPEDGDHWSLAELRATVRRPVGVYLECVGDLGVRPGGEGRVATPQNVRAAQEQGADFFVLGGNPSSGVRLDSVIEATRRIRDELGEDVVLMSGKWEDGSVEPVLGDPRSVRPATAIVADLLDAGADVITLPAPGSRQGISVDMIRECVELTHAHRPGALALTFLNGSVEGADVDTIRQIGLLMKETGADIHAIGDGGLAGCALPENVFQLSLTLKGRGHTYWRMAASHR